MDGCFTGDLWSYNSELNTFVVSPEPDVKVDTIDIKSYRCLIFGTDGLWNMLSPQAAVSIVQAAERHNEKHLIASQQTGNNVNIFVFNLILQTLFFPICFFYEKNILKNTCKKKMPNFNDFYYSLHTKMYTNLTKKSKDQYFCSHFLLL